MVPEENSSLQKCQHSEFPHKVNRQEMSTRKRVNDREKTESDSDLQLDTDFHSHISPPSFSLFSPSLSAGRMDWGSVHSFTDIAQSSLIMVNYAR